MVHHVLREALKAQYERLAPLGASLGAAKADGAAAWQAKEDPGAELKAAFMRSASSTSSASRRCARKCRREHAHSRRAEVGAVPRSRCMRIHDRE